jgi:hypothetical protein
VKRLLPLLLASLLAAPAPAHAGAPGLLLDDGGWRVLGVDAGAIPVSRGGAALGSFARLEFHYDLGAGFVRVLSLADDGTIEPALPPPGVPGASLVLGRYFECEGGLVGPLRFSALELPEQAKGGGNLELRGTLSNFDSLVGEKLKLVLSKPKADVVRAELQFKLRATRDLCVDPERRDTQEEFRIVEIASRYVSPANHLSDLARYVKAIDLDCDTFGDCDFDRRSFCAPLENTTGYVIDSPNRLRDREVQLFHTTSLPAATPTIVVEMFSPSPGDVKPQGFVTASADPNARNVSFWADWSDVKREYRAGKKLASFRFALEAREPRQPGCDRTQN